MFKVGAFYPYLEHINDNELNEMNYDDYKFITINEYIIFK